MLIHGHDLKINPKFESCIPPLTEEEFKQLRDNIVESETIYSPIVIWNDYIVDGHNRYKILQEHPGFMANIFDLSFDYQTEEEVISWICSNQLGRRNLTPEQKKYLVGKQYEAERSAQGGDHCSDEARAKIHGDALLPADAADRVAVQNNTNRTYVQRAYRFAKGIDAVEEMTPGLKDKILSGEIKIRHSDYEALGQGKSVNDKPRKKPMKQEWLREQIMSGSFCGGKTKEWHPAEYYHTPRKNATVDEILNCGFAEMQDALNSFCTRWNIVKNEYGHLYEDPQVAEKLEQLMQDAFAYLHGYKTAIVPHIECEESA